MNISPISTSSSNLMGISELSASPAIGRPKTLLPIRDCLSDYDCSRLDNQGIVGILVNVLERVIGFVIRMLKQNSAENVSTSAPSTNNPAGSTANNFGSSWLDSFNSVVDIVSSVVSMMPKLGKIGRTVRKGATTVGQIFKKITKFF